MSPQPRTDAPLGITVGLANSDRLFVHRNLHHDVCEDRWEPFSITLYVVPLEGYDLVLGVQWLRTLGPVLWDFKHLSMSFWRDDHHVSGLEWTSHLHFAFMRYNRTTSFACCSPSLRTSSRLRKVFLHASVSTIAFIYYQELRPLSSDHIVILNYSKMKLSINVWRCCARGSLWRAHRPSHHMFF